MPSGSRPASPRHCGRGATVCVTELARHPPGRTGPQVAARYAGAFPTAYQEEVSVSDAIVDIGELRALPAQPPALGLQLRAGDATRRALRLRLYRRGDPLAMSDLLPMLETSIYSAERQPYRVETMTPPNSRSRTSRCRSGGQTLDPGAVGARFEQASSRLDGRARKRRVQPGSCSPPGSTGCRPWCSRAVCRYLLQTGLPFSQRYMESVLSRQPFIAQRLSRLFEASFNRPSPPLRAMPASARSGARSTTRSTR